MLTFAIPCLFGLEGLVGNELRHLGLQDVQVENGRVLCRGTPADLPRLNINLRCGERALLLLDTASFFYAGFLWIAVYFSAGAYLNSLLLRKVFAPFLPEDAFAPEESD